MEPVRTLLTLLILTGCASKKEPGPLAGPIHTVVCKGWVNQCYFKAQEVCLRGYHVISSVQSERTGGPWGRYKEFTVQITCKGEKL